MRLITRKRLLDAARKHSKAKPTLEHWQRVTEATKWTHFPDVRATFGHADQVAVKSGKTVTVFNITNDFRLIMAIHFNTQIVYVLCLLTHAEYDKEKWKSQY